MYVFVSPPKAINRWQRGLARYKQVLQLYISVVGIVSRGGPRGGHSIDARSRNQRNRARTKLAMYNPGLGYG